MGPTVALSAAATIAVAVVPGIALAQTPAQGPTRQELMAHYAAGTGRDMASFDYYLLLAMFKGGCILEYKVAQAAKGILSAETGRFFDRLVRGNFAEAEKLIRLIG